MLIFASLLLVVALADLSHSSTVYSPTTHPDLFTSQSSGSGDTSTAAGGNVMDESHAIDVDLRPIIFKSIGDFSLIWKDSGSGANRGVSYWRPNVLAYDYFALGDMVEASHGTPQTTAVVVRELHSDALRPPASFTEIWNDQGSGAYGAVRIMRMNPPSGYKCLGNVAVNSYSATPDVNKYRCVKLKFVTTGGFTNIWNDAGSGAHKDVSNWAVIRDVDVYSQETGCFLSIASHSKPTETAYMLSSHHAMNHMMVNDALINKEAVIKLYRISDVEVVWKDSGSGARYDFSCWRVHGPSGTYRLADIPRGNYNKPAHALIAKALDDSVLVPPSDYWRRWIDSGSGAYWDGAFWEPKCPGGYVAMGHLCTRGYSKPSTNEMRCMKYDFVSVGSWEWVWNDGGSGAYQDGSAYRAVATSLDQQSLDAMGTMGSHAAMDRPAYVLQGLKTTIVEGKPAKSYRVTNVQYELDDRKTVNSEVTNLGRLIVENRGTSDATAALTLEGSWSETRTWSNSFGLEIGVSVEVEAGIPLIGTSTVTVSATTSYSHDAGGEVSVSKTVSLLATVTVKGKHQKSAFMVGTAYRTDVPYTADITTVYEDGTTNKRYGISGVYTGVQVTERRVIFEEDIPI